MTSTAHGTGPAAEPVLPSDEERRRLVRVSSVHLDDDELPHRVELRFQSDQLRALRDTLTPELTWYAEPDNQQDPRGRALRVTNSKAHEVITADRLRADACGTTPALWLSIDLDVVDAAHLAEFAGEQSDKHAQHLVLHVVYRALCDAVFDAYWVSAPGLGGLHTVQARASEAGRTADISVPGEQEDVRR